MSFRAGTAGPPPEKTHEQMMQELYKRAKAADAKAAAVVKEPDQLKLFKVTIPSQTIPTNFMIGKQFIVGKIMDNGVIQGREIIVLGTGLNRIHDQCLEELGCKPHELDMTVEEISGPFAHGTVIAAFFVPGM